MKTSKRVIGILNFILLFFCFTTCAQQASSDSSDSTSALAPIERQSFSGKTILQDYGIETPYYDSLGTMIDKAILLRDPIAIFSLADLLGSLEEISGKKSETVTSKFLFNIGKKYVLFKIPEKKLHMSFLEYLKKLSLDYNYQLSEEEIFAYQDRKEFIEDNPHFSDPKLTSRGGDNNEMQAQIVVNNDSETTLYFYIDSVFIGTVYKRSKVTFPISIGCHELSVENTEMKGSSRVLCLKDIKEHNWNIY